VDLPIEAAAHSPRELEQFVHGGFGELKERTRGYGCSSRDLAQRLRENAMRGSTWRAAGPEAAGVAIGA
jgi:hypothetical protein